MSPKLPEAVIDQLSDALDKAENEYVSIVHECINRIRQEYPDLRAQLYNGLANVFRYRARLMLRKLRSRHPWEE